MAVDSIALMPESVSVGFPAVSGAKVPCACHSGSHWIATVTPADLGLSSLIPNTTPGESKSFRSRAMAIFDPDAETSSSGSGSGSSSSGDDPCATPINADALIPIARAIADAFYRWRLMVNRDIAFPGTLPWELDGSTDWVSISYRPDQCRTRVRSVPYSFEPEELFHATLEDFRGAGHLTDWVYALTPPEGIPGRSGTNFGPLGMGSALCEILEEDDDGEPEATGRFDTIFNPWKNGAEGSTLVAADVRRQPGGRCYLVVKQEDCTVAPSEESSSGSGASG